MESLADHLKTLMLLRAEHVAEMDGHASAIDAIDTELATARGLLGIVDKDGGLMGAVIGYLETHGPTPFHELREAVGRSRHSVLGAVRRSDGRITLEGNTNRRIVRLRRDDRPAPEYVEPVKPARITVSRLADCICQLPSCGKTFTPRGGSGGKFCSRACYDRHRYPTAAKVADDLAAERQPLASTPVPTVPVTREESIESVPIAQETSRTLFPERRCGRCLLKFKPTKDREYVCPLCVDKPKIKTAEPVSEEEYEVVRSGRDITSAEGFGSSLADTSKVYLP